MTAAFPVTNPATLDEIDRVPDQGADGVAEALEAAGRAFADWSRRPADERAEILMRAGRLMLERREELARTLTRENGKPIAEARGEVGAAARYLQWSGEEAKRVYGRVIPALSPHRRYLSLKQPVGLVAAITPWNFPSTMVTRKAGPALAAGCTVVLRPASATPLSAIAISRICHEAGMPDDVFQVVTTARSSLIGELFATHPLVRKITFTGSTEVGKALARMAAGSVKRVSLELGGHAPFLVFADADLDAATDAIMLSKFRNAGQTCITTNRLYAERAVATEVAERVAARAKALRLGDGSVETTQVGPLIDARALDRVDRQVRDAVERGAACIAGGRPARVDGLAGAFYEPTVLVDVPADAAVAREETFGPVLPVIPFDTEDDAIAAANDTTYGLAAYAFTRDLGRAWRIAERLEYGIVGVNDAVPAAPQLPFGGYKESGIGRELGAEALDAFLEVKAVSFGI